MKKVLIFFLLVLTLLVNASQAQTNKITGKVIDEKGMPIAGATIAVKNTKLLALSNAKGAFTIELPAKSISILVSYVGMESVELNV